jgi:perosamine synthetase
MTLRIPLARPEITDADRESVMAVLRTAQLSMGAKLRQFEQTICDYTRVPHALVVNSGTSALQIAIRALKLPRGTEAILPSFTFSALLNVILEEGLRPKFVDIGANGFNTSAEIVSQAITRETCLILAVHTFGFPVDIDAIRSAISRVEPKGRSRQRIHLIEDACEAFGAEIRGRKAGCFGDAALFAFYPNKQITTGEGGVLVTSSEAIADKAVELRNQGRNPALGWLDHADVGFSYRLSDLNCALGISQLRRIESVVVRRQCLAELYDHELARVGDIVRPSLHSSIGRISWFVYPIRLTEQFSREDRDRVCESMLRKGIATGRYFAPLHRQPVLLSQGFGPATLPNTDAAAERVIALPFFNELTHEEIQEVCTALADSVRELR